MQPVISSLVSVTAAVANNLPHIFTPPVVLVRKIDVVARMFPSKVGPPRVAELPTCQKTLHGLPLLAITTLPPVVVSVDAIWKIQTAAELPWASRVRVPDDIVKVPAEDL